ncbi:hypothetical protein BIU88_05740 [Chlorobaculum limnaeum]|uniref:Uncharacterized protein n=1 Tax=Chlorobaculum limnaeum TaxID=274537 RepID=A0A1D8D0R2_CHLLM|nr:hypothetical protein BIU88_05740 [Chlorobaculum limnaeum]
MGYIRKEVRDGYLMAHPEDESMLTPFLSGFFVTWAKSIKEYNAFLKVFSCLLRIILKNHMALRMKLCLYMLLLRQWSQEHYRL